VARKRDEDLNDGTAEGTLNLEDQLPERETAFDPRLAREEIEDEQVPHSEDLDSEGIPELDDELRAKELTGDPQEGMVPPRDYLQAPDDIYARDTLDQRLAEEEPDRLYKPDEEVRLMDPEAGDLEERTEIETEIGDEAGAQSAEEAAIHIVGRPSEHGLVDDDL